MILEVPVELIDTPDVVTFCVGDSTFSISRLLLKYHSSHLDVLLDDESTMFFPDFSEVPHVFEQCVNLLKGCEVEVTLENFKGFLKFGVLNKAEIMYEKLVFWLVDEYRAERLTFVQLHKFSRMAMTFDSQRLEILTHCKTFLAKKGLLIIEKELVFVPENTFDVHFIKLMIDENYIWITLSFLQKILTNQTRAEMILPSLNSEPILSTLRYNTNFTTNFLSHIGSLLVDSGPKHLHLLIKIQENVLRANRQPPTKILPLLSPDIFLESPEKRTAFLSIPAQDILELKHRYSLRDVVYCELLLEWLKVHLNTIKKKSLFIQKAWGKINLSQLSQGYVNDLKRHLDKMCIGEKQANLEIPTNSTFTYNYLGFGFHLTEHETLSLSRCFPVGLTGQCNITECEEKSQYGLCLQLLDAVPCYATRVVLQPPQTHSHAVPVHWWLSFDGSEIISLITNKRQEIVEMLTGDGQLRVYVCCMFQIFKNPTITFP